MKKILLISIALLFGCTVFAQSAVDYPQFPSVTYKCVQMNPDCFPPSCYAKVKDYHPTPPVSGPSYPVTKYNPEMMKPDYPSYPVHLIYKLKPQIMIY
ncbi:MAG: hypothetical protein IH596_12005 [Bacteroidales bacterium]|nr:hypothetical protein [Bacteroidales bacterium]